MSGHTPLPWFVQEAISTRKGFDIQTKNGDTLIVYDLKNKANADLIVRAVNCHDELLAALKAVFDYAEYENGLVRMLNTSQIKAHENARSAIAKAEGR